MSQHPSLRMDSVGAKHRNVLSRLERIKKMQEENRWQERPSIYNLPKIKSVKIKVKKIKEPKVAAEGVEGAAPAAGQASAAGKAAAPAAAQKPAAGADKAAKSPKAKG